MSDLIRIDFKIERDGFVFADAIHLPSDHTMSDAEIEAVKQARFEAWYTLVTTPVEEVIEQPLE
jgi:hypothetical protein